MAALRRKVVERTTIAPDLELHVSTVKVAGETLYEIRNYIPSTKSYGRGVTFPGGDAHGTVVTGLINAKRDVNGTPRLPKGER